MVGAKDRSGGLPRGPDVASRTRRAHLPLQVKGKHKAESTSTSGKETSASEGSGRGVGPAAGTVHRVSPAGTVSPDGPELLSSGAKFGTPSLTARAPPGISLGQWIASPALAPRRAGQRFRSHSGWLGVCAFLSVSLVCGDLRPLISGGPL